MSDRIYFRDGARITEEMLNQSFGFLEEGERRLISGLGVRGIVRGLQVQPQQLPDMSIVVSGGLAFDAQGQRVSITDKQTVDCSQTRDGSKTTLVVPEHERWLAVSVRFTRREGKPFLDKNNRVVAMASIEAFELLVTSGAEGPAGHATRPDVREGEVLLCDVRLHGQESVESGDIDTTRRSAFRFTAAEFVETATASWSTLATHDAPHTSSLQSALDRADRILTAQSERLKALVAEVDRQIADASQGLFERTNQLQRDLENLDRRRGQTQRYIGLFEHKGQIELPTISGGSSVVLAARMPGLKSTDVVLSFGYSDTSQSALIAQPMVCLDGILRLKLTNSTPASIEPQPFSFTVYVSEAELSATEIGCP